MLYFYFLSKKNENDLNAYKMPYFAVGWSVG